MENHKRRRTEVYLAVPYQQQPLPSQIQHQTHFEVRGETPQEIIYSVLTDKQQVFTKTQVLQILEKLLKMVEPEQFRGDCSYIG